MSLPLPDPSIRPEVHGNRCRTAVGKPVHIIIKLDVLAVVYGVVPSTADKVLPVCCKLLCPRQPHLHTATSAPANKPISNLLFIVILPDFFIKTTGAVH